MAKYRKSILELLQEEDELLKARESIANEIISNLYDSEDISLHTIEEREAYKKEADRLKQIEKDILEKLKSNKKDLKRHILQLFED